MSVVGTKRTWGYFRAMSAFWIKRTCRWTSVSIAISSPDWPKPTLWALPTNHQARHSHAEHFAGEAVDPPRVAQILTEGVVSLLLWQFLQRCIDRRGIHDYFWESLQNRG